MKRNPSLPCCLNGAHKARFIVSLPGQADTCCLLFLSQGRTKTFAIWHSHPDMKPTRNLLRYTAPLELRVCRDIFRSGGKG